jgi:hypothetical protein
MVGTAVIEFRFAFKLNVLHCVKKKFMYLSDTTCANIDLFSFLFIYFIYIQMLFCTILKLLITILVHVNKLSQFK